MGESGCIGPEGSRGLGRCGEASGTQGVPAGLPVEGVRILRAVSFISRLQGRSGIAPNCIPGQSSRDRSWCELEGCTRPAAPQGEEPGPATIIKNATIYHQLYLKRMKTSSFLEFTAWLPSLGFFSRDAGSLPCLPSPDRLASWEILPKA